MFFFEKMKIHSSRAGLSLFFLVAVIAIGKAQELTLEGRITSAEDNMALPGAAIQIKGTTEGTITDVEGQYSLTVAPESVLIVSYVGFKSQEIPVNSRSVIDISLELDLVSMEEIVVVGYGSVRKSDLTGSVASVRTEDLVKVPVADPVQAMQGKVSGLQILNASGEPGDAPVIRLRGITTTNNNNPLFVVDGVIIDSGVTTDDENDDNNNRSPLDFLNARDIESVEVLKDASATAIFGARGSNGVIIVTTRRGSKGKVSVSLNAEQGWETVANRISLMNGREFAGYVNDIDPDEPGPYSNFDALNNTDWQDLIFNSGTSIRNYNASFSGANDRVNYYAGVGYYYQEGILDKSDLERITVKLNADFQLSDQLKLGINFSVANYDKQNAPNVINAAYRAWPIDEPYGSNGEFAEVRGNGNPLAAIEYSNDFRETLRAIGNTYLEYNFLPGFTIKSSYQFDIENTKTTNFTPEFFVAPLQQNETSDLTKGYRDSQLWLWENTLSWNKEIDVHRFNAVLGYTIQESTSEFLNGITENLLREGEDFWYVDAGEQDFERADNGGAESAIVSVLFRVNYSLLDRYLFTATYRRDESSKFGPNNRYGVFPSVAVGWNLSNEPFFPQNRIIDLVKIRSSYGLLGNDKIRYLDQFSRISSGQDAVFGTDEQLNPGASFEGAGNPDLKWEETSQFDIGMDLEFLRSRLTAELDYYVKETNDILVLLSPAGYSGYGAFVDLRYNAASVKNSGFEFNVNWRDDVGALSYGVGVLGSTLNNEVTDIGEQLGGASVITDGDLGNGQRVTRTQVGEPIGSFYGYDIVGIYQNDQDLEDHPHLFAADVGDFIFNDTNDDGIINSEDMINLGSSIPDFTYGSSLFANYKGFGVSVDFQGQRGNKIYNGKQAIQFSLLNYETKFVERWTGEGSSSTAPRASQGGVNFQPSEFFVEDGSFLRLRTVTLSYDLPLKLLENLSLGSARVYLRGVNLATWTDWSGYSPDLGARSVTDGVIDLGVYPITRIYSAGMNLTF